MGSVSLHPSESGGYVGTPLPLLGNEKKKGVGGKAESKDREVWTVNRLVVIL